MSRVSEGIRKQVQARAKERCEYCQMPETYAITRFHVDHIIPVRRHHGTDEIDNLAWACSGCNCHKISEIASIDPETHQLTPLFNPRTQQWDEHFEINDGFVLEKTAAGRVTAHLLDMNNLNLVDMRRYLIQAKLW